LIGKIERNTFANVAGTFWSIAVGLLCVPLFIRLLGAEAFGLVGLFLTMQGVVAIFDGGIGATISREIARLEAAGGTEQRDLVFTLQAIYWLIALALGAAIVFLAPLIAGHWVHPQSLPAATVRLCIRMSGAAIALQFPFVFYQCGLLGLQRHVQFNAFSAVIATLRAPGILLLLWLLGPSPRTFFAAQIGVSAAATAGCAMLLWRSLPPGFPATFRRDLLRRHWRFGAAWSANSLANVALLQGDKIILSAILPLGMFGYYTMAQRLVSGLYAIVIAVDGAIFPAFSAAAALGDEAEIARAYHRGAQLMAVLLMPAAAVAAFFSREILRIWTGDEAAAERTHVVLTLLVAGMLLHGLVHAPYYLQVAHDRWRLIARTNGVLLLTILPAYVVMAKLYGAAGAAVVWVVLNGGYLTMVPRMHRTLLVFEQRRWLVDDVVLPLAGAAAVAAAAHAVMPVRLGTIPALGYAALTCVAATVAAGALAPQIRRAFLPSVKRVVFS
jgi:O-antigen/teichoic acid export membrane protein